MSYYCYYYYYYYKRTPRHRISYNGDVKPSAENWFTRCHGRSRKVKHVTSHYIHGQRDGEVRVGGGVAQSKTARSTFIINATISRRRS